MSELYESTTNGTILNVEGGYSNRRADYGGETYKGVSRRFWPGWEGWILIDAVRWNDSFPDSLDDNTELHELVLEFYKENFWDELKGDDIAEVSAAICVKVYEQSINFGIKRPSEWLQETLNLLNRNQVSYFNIPVDGDIGPVTISTLSKALETHPERRVLTLIRCFQGNEYIKIMIHDESQEVNVGWIDRIIL